MRILNEMEPHIEPCGSSHKKTLLVTFIFTPRFPRFK